MNRKTKIIIITVSIIILSTILLLVVGNSFGFFKYLKKGDIVNVITIKGIDVKILNNEDDALNLENAYPIIDSEGMLSTPFEFEMTNNSSRGLDYSIKVENDIEKQETCKLEDGTTCPVLSTDYIKYSYKKNDGTYSEPKILSSTNNVISSGSIATDEKITSSLILWIDSEAGNEIQNHYFFGKLIVTGEQQTVSTFKDTILANNKLITNTPTLTTSSNNTTDASGLYKSTATNSGKPTYYFRGNVENNYVDFAGFTWRIVRINEDGTVRLIMSEGINNNTKYSFNSVENDKKYMYYSNSGTDGAKYQLDTWYANNILNKGYAGYVETGNYYCEEAKATLHEDWIADSGIDLVYFSNYNPDFKCKTDANGYGLVNSNVGLITYEEIVYAGGYRTPNTEFYLYNSVDTSIDYYWHTMSPSGVSNNMATVFVFNHAFSGTNSKNSYFLRPVINLKANAIITGTGISTDPYKIKVQETDSLGIGTSVTATDGSKWHVLEESSSDSKYVTLLSDYNLNSDGTYNTTCGGNINSKYHCSPIAFDTDGTITYNESDNNNIGYFIKNVYESKVLSSLSGTTNVTLPTASQIALVDGISINLNNSSPYSITSSWLSTTNYWTSNSSVLDAAMWFVYGETSQLTALAAAHNNGSGARPVITTLKTNLIYN